MAQFERYGTRDLSYSHWHRHLSRRCAYMDIDGMEYCYRCKQPLLFVETAMDKGQSGKDTSVLFRLAERANVPAVLVLYERGSEYKCECGQTARRVVGMRVRDLWPVRSDLIDITPELWGEEIEKVHERHALESHT